MLGGAANFAVSYATKRYRTNCINWGILPFLIEKPEEIENGDYVFLKGVRNSLEEGNDHYQAFAVKADGSVKEIAVHLGATEMEEREILSDGCLINHYRKTI